MNYDYLNRLEQDNRPETWHDQRPSHPSRPQYLWDAGIKRDDLWHKYDNIIEEELYGAEMEMRDLDHDRIKRARNDAEAASREYSQLYLVWMEEWRVTA